MNAGWAAIPTIRSVPAKQASSMLWFGRCFLTVVMTSVFPPIISGHVIKFKVMPNTDKK